MFARCRDAARRLFGVLSTVTRLLLGLTLWLAKHLLGQWRPPYWLRALIPALGRGLSAVGRKIQAYPRQFAAAVATLAVLGGAGLYGWHWYTNLPQPHTVTYSVQAPSLTDYTRQPLAIDSLRIQFRESVAPLEAINQTVTAGITLSPAVKGTWRWVEDRTLQFTPEQDWPIDTEYQVELARKKLLADGVLLNQYSNKFSTRSFSASLIQSELYQDPINPSLKQQVATVRFTHPVDEDSVRKRISFALGKGLQYRDEKAANLPEISFNDFKLEAYIHSPALATPLENTQISLTLAEGVKAQHGGNASPSAQTRSVTVPGRYRLTFSNSEITFADNDRGEPEPVLMFNSSNALADEAIAGKVKAWLLPEKPEDELEPWYAKDVDEALLARSTPVPLSHVPSVEPLNTQHAFKFKAPAGRTLYVQIPARIEALGGYLAKDPTTALLSMPAHPRTLRFLSDGALLSLNGEKRVGFMARGVPGAHVEIARVLPNQLQHLVDQSSGSFARPNFANDYFDRMVERQSLDIALPGSDPSKTLYDNVDLASYLSANGGRRGIFVLKLSAQDQPSQRTFDGYAQSATNDLRFIVVTDLGIIAKRSSDGSHDLYVQSIDSGLPVAEAQVEIIGRNGLAVSSGKTDAQGHAHFAKLDELRREKTPLMYVVTRGNDQSFLPIARQSQQLDLSRFDVGGLQEDGASNSLSANLFSDRGLYRPGETAHLGMIVRSGDWKGALKGLPVELLISDPRGLTVIREPLTLSASGFERFDFASSETAPAGDYTATLQLIGDKQLRTHLGSVNFKVRDFEPDRMKVSLSLHDTPVAGWIAPDQVQARVSAQHLFGAPAAGRRITASLSLNPALAGFERYPDYRFRLNDSLTEPSNEDLAETSADDNGQAELDLDLKRFANSTYRLQVLAQVYEAEGGRNVAAQSSLLVSSAPYLVGVKSDDPLSYVAKGAARQVQWLAVGPDLNPRAVEGLVSEVIEHRYVSVLVKQVNGTYKYQSRIKDSARPASPLPLTEHGAIQVLDTQTPGDFTLRLKDANGNLLNQIDYSVAGQGNTSRSLERNAELQLRLDKRSYASGEEIAISIRAPYVGAGLITIERDKVYSQQWFKADSTNSVQHIRVPKGLEGNAYINVQFVRDIGSSEVYMSPLSYGVVPFSINLDARRMPLKVEGPAHIEPGQVLDIKVSNDRPTRAVVYAVDEGILQVARYQAPDPLGHFFQKRALEVGTSQILDLILPEFSRLLSGAAPGGDTENALASHLNPFKRKHQPPVAWWSGLVDLPAGESVLHYQLPDHFNGKLRLFAVAVDANSIGVSEGASEVRGPLVITPNVPAFVAPGDVFSVSAGVFSNLEADTAVKFELQTSAGLQVEGEPGRTLQLQPRKEGVAEFRIKVLENLGSADLRFIATLPDGKRIQVAETTSVRPLSEHRVALTLGRFEGTSQELLPSRNLFSELRNVQLGVAASPLVWADGLKHYLDDYAYACTEQLVSKAMPGLIWRDPQATQGFDGLLRVLRQRQNQAGGFGLWAANPQVTPYASLYATDFLIEARERGLAVPNDLLERANAYLSDVANGPSEGLQELRNRAYASYLLSRQGILVSSALSDIRERYETYHRDTWHNDLGAAYLAASYKLLKQDRLADPLFRKIPWRTLNDRWDGDGLYYDPLVHDAEHLHLLSKHFPTQVDDVPLALLDKLGKRLNEQRYNSLSAALLLRALDNYGQRAETGMHLKASAWLSDKSQQLLSMVGQPPRSAVPATTEKLLLEKASGPAAFYMLSEAGFDRGANTQVLSNGLEVIHDYLDLKGQPVSQVSVGDEFLVRLRLRATEHDQVQQVAVVDLLPGGVEPVYRLPPQPKQNDDENQDKEASGEEDDGAWQAPVGESELSNWQPEYMDVRDDRVVFYGTVLRDAATFVYRVRATNAGTFNTPPAYAEGLYQTTLQGRGKVGQLEIVKP
ncbi:alpha-2-macroglobulin [Pseudomonas sp. MAFF 302030]|uniref:Alpha-2-macroglobulin n=1 Tax=Pseudomonas morbosilactucae TaxID=2938197 RepID=A0A9X1YSX4_9PSED|nr:alpha-2-macroglobulin [Pseudomonas morbosilactucae]MCK9797568.1 alpha-2-macroglobulin [Pseudomonas morbosilactucae]